jgi:uncharacterized protein (TIGR03067 family)
MLISAVLKCRERFTLDSQSVPHLQPRTVIFTIRHQSTPYRIYTMKIRTIILSLACAVGFVGGCATEHPFDDAKAVQGTWKPATAEFAGQAMADRILKSISLKLEDGKYVVYVGNEPDRGTYTLDSAARPKGMTVTGTEGPNQGKIFPAIYELSGDTLRICYDLSGAKRPAEFKSIAGTKLYLATYIRQKE